MDIGEQITKDDLLLETRVCRVCNMEKGLLDEYYLSRKNPGLASSYSYECKSCTLKRVNNYNKTIKNRYKVGKCEICEKDSIKLLDGLCRSCNIVLVEVDNNLQTLQNMIQYLNK
tara:strand:+ start:426 stop:770 length:345 start_codon:yes stop_codon:yes gene_type:complete